MSHNLVSTCRMTGEECDAESRVCSYRNKNYKNTMNKSCEKIDVSFVESDCSKILEAIQKKWLLKPEYPTLGYGEAGDLELTHQYEVDSDEWKKEFEELIGE